VQELLRHTREVHEGGGQTQTQTQV
jgi:hypothetical protein